MTKQLQYFCCGFGYCCFTCHRRWGRGEQGRGYLLCRAVVVCCFVLVVVVGGGVWMMMKVGKLLPQLRTPLRSAWRSNEQRPGFLFSEKCKPD